MTHRPPITDTGPHDEPAGSVLSTSALMALFEATADGILLLDAEGTIRFANRAAEGIFGRGDSIVGTSFGVPLLGDGTTEIDVPRSNGTVDVYELRSANSTWNGDNARLVTVREVTERVRSAAAISDLNRELALKAEAASVLSHVGDGIVLLDDAGVVRLWNPAAERILGVDRDLAIGFRIEEVIAQWPDMVDPLPLGEAPFAAAPRGQSVAIEHQGSELWLAITGVRFAAGRVYAFHDLSDEMRLEALKKDFIDSASHELRTPLTSIYGAAHTLRRLDEELDDDIRMQLVDLICVQSERLQRITEDILSARRLDDEPRAMLFEEVDIEALARDVVDRTAETAPSSVRLRVTSVGDVPPVRSDADKLRQVLVNLVQNAVKYSPEGGDVVVCIEEQRGCVQVDVRDEGIGIAEADLDAVFDKFFRAAAGRSSTIAGTGLGLYIARELVTRLDGTLTVDSREGQGSCFSLRLPFVRRGVSEG